MEKTTAHMDFEDWELLPAREFIDLAHEDGKGLISREKGFDPKGVVDVNYFICRSPPSRRPVEALDISGLSDGKNQLITVPVAMELGDPDGELVKEIGEVPKVEIGAVPPVISEKIKAPQDQDPISQVFFKKMKENEFVDMKMDSPVSVRGFKPQVEVSPIQFEVNDEACKGEEFENKASKDATEQEKDKNYMGSEIKGKGCFEGIGINICGWRITGIGALCSLGVAAATICIVIFGSYQKNKQPNQNQKLRFQIYNDDKRIKEVVHRATRLNQALSAVSGAPMARAQITFGGYYDGI